jgi:cytochrome c
VQSIDHCGDTYKVAAADGKVHDFWERNLRFKTDVSSDGPQESAPAIVSAGMIGDRADVIFASPDQISGFIRTGAEERRRSLCVFAPSLQPENLENVT